jgi:stage V sporulation protein SpoVS
MSQSAAPNPQADAAGQLEEATDQAIAACPGDARGAVKALIVANGYLEAEVRELRAAVSSGYARGKFDPVPRDRKDWYD